MPWRCPVGSAAQSEALPSRKRRPSNGAAPASSSAPCSPALIFEMLAVAANCFLTRCHVGSACAPWRSAEAKSLARRSTQRRWTFPAGEPNRFSESGWHAENSWTFCWALAGCRDSGDPTQHLPTISELPSESALGPLFLTGALTLFFTQPGATARAALHLQRVPWAAVSASFVDDVVVASCAT